MNIGYKVLNKEILDALVETHPEFFEGTDPDDYIEVMNTFDEVLFLAKKQDKGTRINYQFNDINKIVFSFLPFLIGYLARTDDFKKAFE